MEQARNSNEIFGQRLGEIRYKRGISQRQLGELIGVSGSMICGYEAGRYINPRFSEWLMGFPEG